jgi:hypothetical protein
MVVSLPRFAGRIFEYGLLRELSLARWAVAGETKMLTRAIGREFVHCWLLRRTIPQMSAARQQVRMQNRISISEIHVV